MPEKTLRLACSPGGCPSCGLPETSAFATTRPDNDQGPPNEFRHRSLLRFWHPFRCATHAPHRAFVDSAAGPGPSESNEPRAGRPEIVLDKEEWPFAIRAAVERLFFRGPHIHSDDAPGNKVRKGIQVTFANPGIEKLSFIQGQHVLCASRRHPARRCASGAIERAILAAGLSASHGIQASGS